MKSARTADSGAEYTPRLEPDADHSTRQRVVRSIMIDGPSTAADLARRLGLTPAAVRRHLGVLLDRGQLSAREARNRGSRSRGRPAKVFVLTDVGRSDFPQAYDTLAIQALDFLHRTAGPDAVQRFAEARVADVRRRFAEIVAAEPDVARSEALSRALTADGYEATVRPVRSGAQVCQHHCPVAHVAEQFPQLCQAETDAFADLLGVHVQRLATIADGDGVCTTHVPGGGPLHRPSSHAEPDGSDVSAAPSTQEA